MSLNQAIALMQKAFKFQGTVNPTVNNNSTPQSDLSTVDTTRSATAEVFQEFGKTDIMGPPINEK